MCNMRVIAACAIAALSTLTGCGSGAETKTVTASQTVTVTSGSVEVFGGPPPVNVVREWAQLWCRVTLGMSKTEVRGVMGTPTSETGDQLGWDAYEWVFTAVFDTNGKAIQLSWTKRTEEPPLPRCAEFRMVRTTVP